MMYRDPNGTVRLPSRPRFENSFPFCFTVYTPTETIHGLFYSAHMSNSLSDIDVFFSLEMEPQFKFKISVLGLKVEFYPTKCMGDLDWTPIGDGNS